MSASVIICTHNRARLLERALRSLAHQTARSQRFEIVVVDDCSTDGTARLCERMRKDLPNMTHFSLSQNLGLAVAANRGVGLARGEFLLFTDDDCIVQDDWVECLTASLEREFIVAGAVMSPKSKYIKFCHNISQFHPFMKAAGGGEAGFIAGANMGMRRSLLEDLGGFDERSKVPDMELVLRARARGYRVHFAPRAVVLHDPDRTNLATVLKYSSEHASETILLRNKYSSLLRTPFVLRSSGLILPASPLIALLATLKIYASNPSLARYFWTAPLVYVQKLAWCWGAARGLSALSRKSPDPKDSLKRESSRRF